MTPYEREMAHERERLQIEVEIRERELHAVRLRTVLLERALTAAAEMFAAEGLDMAAAAVRDALSKEGAP